MKIPIKLSWTYLQGDKTEYQQRSVELEPIDVSIVVELDANPKYFANKEVHKYWEDKIVADLADGKAPTRITTPSPSLLTPEGAAEVRRIVNEALYEQHPFAEQEEDTKAWEDEEDYDNF